MRRSTLLFHVTQAASLYYPGEDAKEKKSTMDVYWMPGVNNLMSYGRWAFAEFTEVYQIESDFEAKGTVSEHIKHIFEDGELNKEATVRLFRTVQQEGD